MAEFIKAALPGRPLTPWQERILAAVIDGTWQPPGTAPARTGTGAVIGPASPAAPAGRLPGWRRCPFAGTSTCPAILRAGQRAWYCPLAPQPCTPQSGHAFS